MESRGIERKRSDAVLRWIAAGLALAVLLLAAACGGEDQTAGRADASAEVIGLAAAPAPIRPPAVPEQATATAPVTATTPVTATAPATATTPVTATVPVTEAATSVLPPETEEPRVTYGEAEAVFLDGRYGEAVDLFVRYVERRPTHPRGHYMLGLSAWKGGYLELAEAHLAESVLIDPGHVRGRVNLARVLIELGRPDVAREHARIAEELDPGYVPAKRTLARALAGEGDHEAALAKYEEALWMDPGDRWSLNNMGYLMIQRGLHEDAVAPLALAVRLDSTNATFRNNLDSALANAGLGVDIDTDAIALAYLRELGGCAGEAADTVARRR